MVTATDTTSRIRAAAADRANAVVRLASELIALDTTARDLSDPPRQEAALQAHLAARLRTAGASVQVLGVGPGVPGSERQVPATLSFEGRPQLIARFGASTGTGRSLIFNGHIDAVSASPREAWSHDPFDAIVRDGLLYGLGSCDMKGGVAAMVVAAELLAELEIPLAGELIVNTVTDEEYCGAGTAACIVAGLRADAAIIPEPTSHHSRAHQPPDMGGLPRDPLADDHRGRAGRPCRARAARLAQRRRRQRDRQDGDRA